MVTEKRFTHDPFVRRIRDFHDFEHKYFAVERDADGTFKGSLLHHLATHLLGQVECNSTDAMTWNRGELGWLVIGGTKWGRKNEANFMWTVSFL